MISEFDTENFILNSRFRNDAAYIAVIDRLCKKIDVVKKVFKRYSTDLSEKRSDIEISNEAYLQLFSVFVQVCSQEEDFKVVNSTYKLNDILLDKNIITVSTHQEHESKLLNLSSTFGY